MSDLTPTQADTELRAALRGHLGSNEWRMVDKTLAVHVKGLQIFYAPHVNRSSEKYWALCWPTGRYNNTAWFESAAAAVKEAHDALREFG